MVSNIGSSRTVLSYDSLKTSIAKLDEEIANRSFSLLKSDLYEVKKTITTKEMFSLIRKRKSLYKELYKLCNNFKSHVLPQFEHELICE